LAQWLDVLQFTYNNATHSSHKDTPARLLLGYKPHSPLDFLSENGQSVTEGNPNLHEHLCKLEAHREAARDAIRRSTDQQAYQFDKGRQAPKFKIGDEVLINPHSLELVDIKGCSRKLMQRRIGPFEIIGIINPTTYKLRLPDTYPMHNMVNIQHLTLYRRSEDKARPILANPRDSLNSTKEYEVEKIVEERKNKGKTIYRVQWKGFDAESDT
jgi:hypothetical protein